VALLEIVLEYLVLHALRDGLDSAPIVGFLLCQILTIPTAFHPYPSAITSPIPSFILYGRGRQSEFKYHHPMAFKKSKKT